MYHHYHPAGMNTSYEYAPYPQSTYESQQIPQPPLRSVRSGSAPHSPHQHSQFPSQNPYPSNYPPPPPYPMAQPPAPPPPQWAPEAWTNYNQPFSSPAPIQDVPFNSGPGRPNDPTVPPTSVEPRPYSSSQSNPTPNPRPTPDRPPTPPPGPAVPATQPKRRRDKETPAPPSGSDTPPRLDFLKVITYYPSPLISHANYHRSVISCWNLIASLWTPVMLSQTRRCRPLVDHPRLRRWNECFSLQLMVYKCWSPLLLSWRVHPRQGRRVLQIQ